MRGPYFWILPIFLGLISCQIQPTKVFESSQTQAKGDRAGTTNLARPSRVKLDLLTLIVDARPAFDFALSHINGSIPLRPEDFTQKDFPFFGELEKDHFALTRYLARKGISQDTPVIVVGRGLKGEGEEGRVAWTLRYLGVKNVRSMSIDYFSIPLSTQEAPPREAEIIWKPEIREDLSVDLARAQEIIRERQKNNPAWVVIDVRSSSEYLGKDLKKLPQASPDIGAINIPWNEFFDSEGFADSRMQQKLKEIGIEQRQGLLLISNQGIRSAAVLMALRDLGFSNATHFPGGYMELMQAPRKASP